MTLSKYLAILIKFSEEITCPWHWRYLLVNFTTLIALNVTCLYSHRVSEIEQL